MNSEIGQHSPSRFILAFKAFFRVFTDRQFADGVLALLQNRQPMRLEDQTKPEPVISKPMAPPMEQPKTPMRFLSTSGRLHK